MEFDELVKIMETLRRGCPWDRKQTHVSLKPYLLEEAYELIEAIDSGDPNRMKEELGDLLLQIVFHSQLARERGQFGVQDVIQGISDKMVNRHPHVFGKGDVMSREEASHLWMEKKKEEGKLKESILEGVPVTLPSLLRALLLQTRASSVGFDWKQAEDVLAKMDEELREFRQAVTSGRQAAIEAELGDLLFAIVNVARFTRVDPEGAMHKTINRFISRFQYIELRASQVGISLKDMSIHEMEELWEEAKGEEAAKGG